MDSQASSLFLDWKEQFELGWQLLFRVQAVGKVDTPDATVGMDLYPQSFNVVCSVSSASEI